MDNFNRVISFVLGLIVVIVFLVFITRRLNLKERLLSKTGPTKTPTPTFRATTPIPQRIPTEYPIITRTAYNQNNKPTTIPSTGSPTILLAFLFSSLGAGVFLKKRGSFS